MDANNNNGNKSKNKKGAKRKRQENATYNQFEEVTSVNDVDASQNGIKKQLPSPNKNSDKKTKTKRKKIANTKDIYIEQHDFNPENARKALALESVEMLEHLIEVAFDGDIPNEVKKSNIAETQSENKGLEWPKRDIEELLKRMKEIAPASDTKNAVYRQEHLDWESVAFGEHSADSCKNQWELLSAKVMKQRTLVELLAATHDHVMRGDNLLRTHPNFPKKPMTPFMNFFLKKREKYAAKNPDLKHTELAKFVGKKYEKLSEAKKEKYKLLYQKEMEQYNAAVETIRRENPLLSREVVNETLIPVKPPSACENYVAYMMMKRSRKHPDMNHDELSAHFEAKWNMLEDDKRKPYIDSANAEYEQYAIDLYNYFEHAYSECFAKKANVTGFAVFASVALPSVRNLPFPQKRQELSKKYKSLNGDDKKAFEKYAKSHNKVLKIKTSKKTQQLSSSQTTANEQGHVISTKKKEKLPGNAYSLFTSEYIRTLTSVPGKSKMQLVADKWKSMTEDEKNEYRRKSAKLKKKFEKKLRSLSEPSFDAVQEFPNYLDFCPMTPK